MADNSLSQEPLVHISAEEERALSVCLGLAFAGLEKLDSARLSKNFIETLLTIKILSCRISIVYQHAEREALSMLHCNNYAKVIRQAVNNTTIVSNDYVDLLKNIDELIELSSAIAGVAFATKEKGTIMGYYAENDAELRNFVNRISNTLFTAGP
jgi:hypothetical protein